MDENDLHYCFPLPVGVFPASFVPLVMMVGPIIVGAVKVGMVRVGCVKVAMVDIVSVGIVSVGIVSVSVGIVSVGIVSVGSVTVRVGKVNVGIVMVGVDGNVGKVGVVGNVGRMPFFTSITTVAGALLSPALSSTTSSRVWRPTGSVTSILGSFVSTGNLVVAIAKTPFYPYSFIFVL
jgi:hypothetical protein